jgi:hypothetical protein
LERRRERRHYGRQGGHTRQHPRRSLFVGGIVDKVTLEQTDNAPALASHGGRLFQAWRGSGNDDLNLAFSGDGGATFQGKATFAESSGDSPSLVSHASGLFLTWRGSGNENLNIARVRCFASTFGAFGIDGLDNKVTLCETSDFSPALGSVEGVPYLAWRGSGNEDLSIIASSDGQSFSDKRISLESSSDAPALATVRRRGHPRHSRGRARWLRESDPWNRGKQG